MACDLTVHHAAPALPCCRRWSSGRAGRAATAAATRCGCPWLRSTWSRCTTSYASTRSSCRRVGGLAGGEGIAVARSERCKAAARRRAGTPQEKAMARPGPACLPACLPARLTLPAGAVGHRQGLLHARPGLQGVRHARGGAAGVDAGAVASPAQRLPLLALARGGVAPRGLRLPPPPACPLLPLPGAVAGGAAPPGGQPRDEHGVVTQPLHLYRWSLCVCVWWWWWWGGGVKGGSVLCLPTAPARPLLPPPPPPPHCSVC